MTAAKPAPVPLRVLLVGNQEEDFFLIREILERSRSRLAAELEHARSIDEARTMLQRQSYGLVLFEHETGDEAAVHLVADFLRAGVSVPFILLTEDADEKSVAEIIGSGTWNCLPKSQLDGDTLVRTIRGTIALHSLQLEQHSTEESLRKLSRAVEQSADTVIITDRSGVIEYVNPAFENVTGFSRAEAFGQTPNILKSGEQAAETYQEMWKTLLEGNSYRGILVNRKKNATSTTSKKASARCVTPTGRSLTSSRTAATSQIVCASKRNCCRRKRWMQSDDSPEASRTTSTTC